MIVCVYPCVCIYVCGLPLIWNENVTRHLCSSSIFLLPPICCFVLVVWDGIYVDFFYGLFAGLVLLLILRPHWGALYTQDKDVQDLGMWHKMNFLREIVWRFDILDTAWRQDYVCAQWVLDGSAFEDGYWSIAYLTFSLALSTVFLTSPFALLNLQFIELCQ